MSERGVKEPPFYDAARTIGRNIAGLLGVGTSAIAGPLAALVEEPISDQLQLDANMSEGNADLAALAATGLIPFGMGTKASKLSQLRRVKSGESKGQDIGGPLALVNKPPLSDFREIDAEPGLLKAPTFTPEPGAVSTRYPTAVKREEDPLSHNLVIGIDEFRREPELFKHNVQITRSYPNMPRTGARGTEAQAEEFIEHAKNNLLFLFDSVPPEIRDRSQKWYDGANRLTSSLAGQYRVSPEAASGVMAALSPQKDWFMNADLGRRVIDTWSTQVDTVFDGPILQKALELFDEQRYGQIILSLRGKRLGDLDLPAEKAIFVRSFDQLNNSPSYNIVSPEGELISPKMTNKGVPAKVAWNSNGEVANAIRMLDSGGDLSVISDALGQYHKVRNFYNNIRNPNSPNGYITVDTHAVAAALLRPLAGKDREVAHMFGSGKVGERGPKNSSISGVQGLYGLYADAYRRAAGERFVQPRQMQSITWEAVRGLYTPGYKGQKTNKEFIDKIWMQFKANKISLDEARQRIVEHAGGINPPEWMD
tara:strand:- start:9038 stop:10651 length:1614 start_codon:yes stop_codon:yes gene_type:complete